MSPPASGGAGGAHHAVYLVTNNGDADYPTDGSYNGTGSLRQAAVAANLNPGLDTIQFDLPQGQKRLPSLTTRHGRRELGGRAEKRSARRAAG